MSTDRFLRVSRRVAWASRVWWKHGLPSRIVRFDGGLGDDLLCGVVGREFRKRGERNVWMASRHVELFEHNQDFRRVLAIGDDHTRFADDDDTWFVRRLRVPVLRPIYAAKDPATDTDAQPGDHLLAVMCGVAGIRGQVTLRPYLHLTTDERTRGRLGRDQVAIQSSGLSARYPMLNKEWFPDRFASVAERLKGQFTLVQVGSATDPLLPGALDLRGKTKPRETAAILSQSRLFIGLVGFLMHLARAVECPAVILYGGRELPAQSGYSANENLTTALPCSPCWKWNTCDHDRDCMKRIDSEQVLLAVERQLQRTAGAVLTEDTAEVQ